MPTWTITHVKLLAKCLAHGRWPVTSGGVLCLFLLPSCLVLGREFFSKFLPFLSFLKGRKPFQPLGMWCLIYFWQSTRRSSEDCALGIATGVLLCPLHETVLSASSTQPPQIPPPKLVSARGQEGAAAVAGLLLLPTQSQWPQDPGERGGAGSCSAMGSALVCVSPCPSAPPAPVPVVLHCCSSMYRRWSPWIRRHLPTVGAF